MVLIDKIGHNLEQMLFVCSRFDPTTGTDIATRLQIPLQLSYETTIHKAQGLTLDHVIVNCSGIFNPGQLSVAMGRARSSTGLQVTNFLPRHAMTPKDEVLAFINDHEKQFSELCCRKDRPAARVFQDSTSSTLTCTDDSESSEDETVDEMEVLNTLKELMEGTVEAADEDKGDVSIQYVTTDSDASSSTEPVSEPDQQLPPGQPGVTLRVSALFNSRNYLRETMEAIDDDKKDCMRDFSTVAGVQNLADKAALDFFNFYQTCDVTSRGQTKFFSYVYNYSVSTFPDMIRKDLGKVSRTGHKVLLDMLKAIRLKVVEKRQGDVEQAVIEPDVSKSSKGKVRYLAGRCIAKCTKNAYRYLTQHSSNPRHTAKCSSFETKVEHLNFIRTSYEDLQSSDFSSSLQETERRQNLARGLTHVTDETYLFFIELEKERQKKHHLNNVKIYTKLVLSESLRAILNSEALKSSFHNIFESMDNRDSSCIDTLFVEIVRFYMSVANNEFRKFLCRKLQKEKKFRHRVNILTKKKTKKDTLTPKDTQPTASTSQEKAHDVPTSAKSKQLKTRPVAKKRSSEDQVVCFQCKTLNARVKYWIKCKKCNKSFHRKCAGLAETKKWTRYNSPQNDWTCVNW